MATSRVTIYHNPRCSKSRQTLALLRERGIEPRIVEYLRDPPDTKTIARLVAQLGVEPRDVIRNKEFKELGLTDSDDPRTLLALIAAYPQILERPIVVVGDQARLGRPPEQVLEILPE